MTSSIRLATEKGELEERRTAAITALADAAGVEVPEIRRAGWPKPLANAEYLVGSLAVDTFALEMIQTLATEVDALKAELAAVRGSNGKAKK